MERTRTSETARAAENEVIKISGLTKRYGEKTAVDHLDLTVCRGEIFGLLGPTGRGKPPRR